MSGNVWDRCEDTHYTICGGGYYFPVGYCAVDDYRPDSPDRSSSDLSNAPPGPQLRHRLPSGPQPGKLVFRSSRKSLKDEEAEGMPCLEAEPESWQTGGGGGLGGTTSVSSDSRGAQHRPHPVDKAALARGKNGRRRSIALQGFAEN